VHDGRLEGRSVRILICCNVLLLACRDGYTDLRGKFDYVTLTSTSDMSRVTRYSLLAASPGLGSVMAQAAPPPK
jgi:hypothetical protein